MRKAIFIALAHITITPVFPAAVQNIALSLQTRMGSWESVVDNA